MEYKIVIAIDPGINTGVAVFKDKTSLPETHVFSVEKFCKTHEDKLLSLCQQLNKALSIYETRGALVLIEGVQVWGSAVSHAAAARGDLSFLAYIVGVYYTLCAVEYSVETLIIKPTDWKGQLTETALREWIRRDTGMVYENEHVLSAVGLGILTKGRLWQ